MHQRHALGRPTSIVEINCIGCSSESWEPKNGTHSLALSCRWRSRPQHQQRTVYHPRGALILGLNDGSVLEDVRYQALGSRKLKVLPAFSVDVTAPDIPPC